VTKDKGSSAPRKKEVKTIMKTNHVEGSWNVGKWSPLRVRVFVNVSVLTQFCSINRRCMRYIEEVLSYLWYISVSFFTLRFGMVESFGA
jgi:hypothetical protein